MIDREKVIKGLECHQIDKDHRINCSDCPYHCDEFMNGLNELHNDALALLKKKDEIIKELQNAYGYLKDQFFDAKDKLLKEQEAVKPKSKVRHGANAQIQHFCGNCMKMLHGKPKFCSECGRPILWEGR